MNPKCFCNAKENVTRLKRQSVKWEKIFESCTSEKGLSEHSGTSKM
jgi:hypothetical protein